MKRFYYSLACLAVLFATSLAEAVPPRLTTREKRAACAVAFYHVFYRNSHHRAELRRFRKKGGNLTPIFVEAFDDLGQEVTPAALITALRNEGLNVYPAWTEKKWRRSHDPKYALETDLISLTHFKYLKNDHIQWLVQDWHLVARSGGENSLTASTIELHKQDSHWVVVRWRVNFAAG